MIRLNLTLRNLLKKYIPLISEKDIEYFETLEALRFMYQAEDDIQKVKISKSTFILDEKKEAPWDKSIQERFNNKQMELDQIQNLWVARRRLALQITKFFPFPINKMEWNNYWAALKQYRKIQLLTLYPLLKSKLKDTFSADRKS